MANSWYVATTGASNNAGSLASPWDLQTALNGGFPANSVQPGDTIWVRGGTYNKTDTNWSGTLVGTALNPILIRNYLGDHPALQERAIIQETNTSAAATSGATTVNGVNGSGSSTLSIAKAAGVNQPLAKGAQITIASGPAVGVYVCNSATTLTAGGNTSVSILPNLRGATAGGEAITLTLIPSGVDNLNFNGLQFVRFWGVEFNVVLATRTLEGGSSNNFECFNSNVDGIKLIHAILHDGAGNCFVDYQSNDFEQYGCISYNAGDADPNVGDGGGHHLYGHHQGIVKRLRAERNIYFNDHGVSVQFYSTAGVRDFEEGWDFVYNVIFNSGTLNNLANTGGKDATNFVMGGAAETMHDVTVDHNYFWNANNYGDRNIQVGFNATGRLGANIVVTNNYGFGGGSGFGVVHFNGTLAAGGSVTFTGNEFVVQAAAAGWNGNAARFADTLPAPAGWTVGNNIYHRVQGTGEPPISAFVTSAHPFGTIAQWISDTGFSTDTSPATNPTTTKVVTIPTTKYEAARGHVIYYNYAGLSSIPFNPGDLGLVIGDTFFVHDVRNVWAGVGGQPGTPVVVTGGVIAASGGAFIWTGGNVNLPNTQISDPVQTGSQWNQGWWETSPPATAPNFNAFLVRRTVPVLLQTSAAYVRYRGLTNALVMLATGPADLYVLVLTNSSGAAAFVQLFDASAPANVTLGTTPPDMQLQVAAGATISLALGEDGLRFANGIVVASTTTDGGSTGSGSTVSIAMGV